MREAPAMPVPPPVVLVLASGRGRRFNASGGAGSKLHALLAGRPVLEWTLDAVRRSGLPWRLEAQGHEGMGDSIAAGVQATRNAPGWLVLPGDLPLVRPDTLRAVAVALADQPVVVPWFEGRRGHPVGFGRACRDALLRLEGEEGAVSVVRCHDQMNLARHLAVQDPGVLTDVDTVEDLAGAERLLAAGRPEKPI